jgi:hypothetical protein
LLVTEFQLLDDLAKRNYYLLGVQHPLRSM